MAILRSTSGKFYEIPDDQLSQYEVPADLVQQVQGLGGPGGPEGGPGGPEAGPGPEGGPEGEGGDVEPYGFRIHFGWGRRHYWRNCWRNHWRNCY